MSRRSFNIISLISTILFGLTVLLWIVTYGYDPWEQRLSITDTFHVGVWTDAPGGDLNIGRIEFFNNKDYGPYRGSVIGLIVENGKVIPPLERRITFGDCYGIYYRYFRWTDATLWTLAVSWWYPLIFFGVIPGFWLILRPTRIKKKHKDTTD